MARSAVRPRARSRIEDHHAEWLSLVETSGPFLTVPALEAGASGRARGDDDHAATCGSRTRSGRATRDCSGGGSAGCSTSCSDCAMRSPRRPMPTRRTASPSRP